jgi:LPS sulfotransferase NodH
MTIPKHRGLHTSDHRHQQSADAAAVVPAQAERGYVICSEHRSGSTLLCQWLASTGMLGYPAEYFARTESAIAIERDPDRLSGILERATTPNGVYGFKLFSQQFDTTMKARWLQRLPAPCFIHLERRDLLGQAISFVRAMQTQQYLAHERPQALSHYDARAIHRQLRRLAEAQSRWRLYFARNGIPVLWLVYEDMVRDPHATIRAIAERVGVEGSPTIDPALVSVAVQRDGASREWRDRFIAEMGDPAYLDHPLGMPRIWLRRRARDVGQWLRGKR